VEFDKTNIVLPQEREIYTEQLCLHTRVYYRGKRVDEFKALYSHNI